MVKTKGFNEGPASRSGPFSMPTVGQVMLELAAPTAEHWRIDPAGWAADKIGAHLWSKQREILQSVQEHRKTAVHSCHEVGKSYSAAMAVAHWLDTHPPGEAFALTSASSLSRRPFSSISAASRYRPTRDNR